jgi:hypothetical protein
VSQPLLLLDVDGPLNPYAAKPHRRPEGYATHRLRPAGWERAKNPLRVWLNPAHGPMLTSFAEEHAVELAWATTWERDANPMIGQLIGLPELPVIEWGFRAHHWKFDGVLEFADGRPLAWLDDDFARFRQERAWFEARRGDVPTLLHHVDPAVGLRPEDLDAVAAWLTSAVAA